MCNAESAEAYEKECSKRIMLSAVTMRNCVAVALIQVRDGSGARPDGRSKHQQKRNPMKIYESEKILFDACKSQMSRYCWRTLVDQAIAFPNVTSDGVRVRARGVSASQDAVLSRLRAVATKR